MTKGKAILCTILLAIVIFSAMIGGLFLCSDILKMNLTWFVVGCIGFGYIEKSIEKFYHWLLKDKETK